LKEEKSYNQFDELIKDKFSSGIEQPDDIFWKRLNDQLKINDEKFIRRRFFRWGFGSVLLIITIGICLFFANKEKSDLLSKNNNVQPTLVKNPKVMDVNEKIAISKYKQSANNSTGHNVTEKTTTFEFGNSEKNESIKQDQLGRKEINNLNDSLIQNKAIETTGVTNISISEEKPEDSYTLNQQTKIDSEKSAELASEVSEPDELNGNDFKTVEMNSDQSTIEEKVLALAESSLSELNKDAQSFDSTISNNSTLSLDPARDLPIINESSDSLHILADNTTLNTELSLVDSAKVLNGGTNDPPPGIKPLKKTWSLGVSLNPVYSYRNLKDGTSSSTVMNAAHYNAYEKGSIQLNMGLSAGYRINNLISVRSGINYASYKITYKAENLSMNYDVTDKNLSVETTYGDFEIDQEDFEDDDDTDFIDNVLNEEDTNIMVLSFSNSQTLKFLQIPIEIEFGMQRNKFRYFFRTGFSYSYLISEKSEFVTDGFAPVKKDNVSLLHRNSLTTSFAVGVEYVFNQNWALLLSPNFTYYLTSLNRNLAFKTMPFWVGLETSVKYYLK
jgi:hypothetical protein